MIEMPSSDWLNSEPVNPISNLHHPISPIGDRIWCPGLLELVICLVDFVALNLKGREVELLFNLSFLPVVELCNALLLDVLKSGLI